ncbi:hypothetical protein [Chryseobacterium indologenes]|uniref:hypothetical protein n=1 Tax=Chryseobacterium indologenes TaxID=253 RepID=UPI00162742A7|nr:hypothetical protein [Chryseobacterium indologenes]
MNKIIEWAAGNPGALNFLMTVYMSQNTSLAQASIINNALENYTTLRGTNIYILYSDLCGRNMDKVVHLIKNCPQEILEEACSRQDYSGREMVAEYMMSE